MNTEDNGGVRVYNFNTSLSIETTKFSNDVSLFPNPTTDQISIKGVQVKNITVFNLNGQQIFSSSKETISIKDFPKGMYLLKIIDLKGKTIYRKIIKN